MITYRTRLFDMRLDDLSDPDHRWSLLSDTASKHSQTDPVAFLYHIIFGQLVFSQFTLMKVLACSNRRYWGAVSEATISRAIW